MSFARARAASGLRNGLRQATRPSGSSKTFNRTQLQAKRYASSEHGHQKSSDIPWLIGALVITPPSCWYLWPSKSDHGHDDGHHDGFDDKQRFEKHQPEEKEEEEEPKEESDAEQKEAEKEDEEKVESEEKEDGAQQVGKGGDSKVEGVNFKGKMMPDSDGQEHNVKLEDDDKGANKKRLDSGLAKNLGPASREGERGESNDMASKQAGISNTQTRHSIPIHESDEKSKKPDGTPETSKHVGTVDPAKMGTK